MTLFRDLLPSVSQAMQIRYSTMPCHPVLCFYSPTAFAHILAVARRMHCVICWTKALCVMFCLNDTMRYYLCPGRTDMRKGISFLCGVVHEKIRSDVRNGDVFIFIDQSSKLMKQLHAEDCGMVIYVKRLEAAGRFKLLKYDKYSELSDGVAGSCYNGGGHIEVSRPAPCSYCQGGQ